MNSRKFLRATMAFFYLFLKNALSYKVSFIWVLIMPAIFLIFSHIHWFENKPTPSEFVSYYVIYLGFIITISTANGVGVGLLMLRENGFLKMFKFISGNKYTVLVGFFLAQFLFIMLNIFFFSTFVSLIFLPHLFLQTIFISLLCGLITIPPISILFSWIPILNIKQETLAPITTILPILLTYITNFTYNVHDQIFIVLALLNPIELVSRLTSDFFSLEGYTYSFTSPMLITLIILLFFSFGFYTLRKIQIVSKIVRN